MFGCGAGCLQRLYDAVAGDDILLLVNTLQFLPAIARSPQGAGFVIESGERFACFFVRVFTSVWKLVRIARQPSVV